MNSVFWICLFTVLPGFLMMAIAFLGIAGFLGFMSILFGIPVAVQYRREREVEKRTRKSSV